MPRRLVPLVLAALVGGLLTLIPLASPGAAAVGVPKAGGVALRAQNWYAATLRVGWKKVPYATYVVRASTVRTMRYPKVVKTTTNAATLGPLSRGKTWYVQVRAVRSGKVGAWSGIVRMKFRNAWPSPTNPAAGSQVGAARVTWPYAAYSTDYQVKFTAAPYDQRPGTTTLTSWLPQGTRAASRAVPTSVGDSSMTAVPFANPTYVQVRNRNVFMSKSGPKSGWKAVFPAIPQPRTGSPVRLGTYNVSLGTDAHDSTSIAAGSRPWGERYPVIARNIADNDLSIVALQEVLRNRDRSTGADSVVGALRRITGRDWRVAEVERASEAQVIYDAAQHRVVNSGILNDHPRSSPTKIVNARTGAEILVPFVTFVPTDGRWTRPFMVVPAHFAAAVTDGSQQARNNYASGTYAHSLLRAVGAVRSEVGPADAATVIAGDFTVNNTLYGDASTAANAQATLVKNGYYDAMAAVSKSGVGYATGNKFDYPQQISATGSGPRPDAIFLKGIVGSTYYRNVANYRGGLAKPPSDHNLVLAHFMVPPTS